MRTNTDLVERAKSLELDAADYEKLLRLFALTAEADLRRLEAAVAETNLEEVSAQVHSIRGVTDNLNLHEMRAAIESFAEKARSGSLRTVEDELRVLRAELRAIVDLLSSRGPR